MLSPADIRPFLTHPVDDVRGLALRYVKEAHDPSPVTAGDLLASIQGFPSTRDLALSMLGEVPVTDATFSCLTEALGWPKGESDTPLFVAHVMATLPLDAVRRALADAAIAGRLSPAGRGDLHVRITLAEKPFDRLVQLLQEQVDELDVTAGFTPAGTYVYMLDLVRALAEHPRQAVPWALSLLDTSPNENLETLLLRGFAAHVFQFLPIPGAPDSVLRRLLDVEIPPEVAVAGLTRAGTPELAEALAAGFPHQDEEVRALSAQALGRIKLPASEQAALRLFRADPAYRPWMSRTLCALCTTDREALDAICALVIGGHTDPRATLHEDLTVLGKMVGWSPPDPAAWEVARAAQEAENQRLRRERTEHLARRARDPAHRGDDPPFHKKQAVFKPYGKKSRKAKTPRR